MKTKFVVKIPKTGKFLIFPPDQVKAKIIVKETDTFFTTDDKSKASQFDDEIKVSAAIDSLPRRYKMNNKPEKEEIKVF